MFSITDETAASGLLAVHLDDCWVYKPHTARSRQPGMCFPAWRRDGGTMKVNRDGSAFQRKVKTVCKRQSFIYWILWDEEYLILYIHIKGLFLLILLRVFYRHYKKQQSLRNSFFNFNTSLNKLEKKLQSQILKHKISKNYQIEKTTNLQVWKLLRCWFNNKRPDIQPAT